MDTTFKPQSMNKITNRGGSMNTTNTFLSVSEK